MDDRTLICVGVSWLAILEAIALILKFDGQAFSLVVGTIAALVGYAFKSYQTKDEQQYVG